MLVYYEDVGIKRMLDLAFAVAAVPEEAEDGQGNRGDEFQRGQSVADAVHRIDYGHIIALDAIDVPAYLLLFARGLQLEKGTLTLQILHGADGTEITHGAPPFLLTVEG